MKLTKHGKRRSKERTGIGKSDKKLERAAQLALERGLDYKDLKGSFRRYIDNRRLKADGTILKVHGSQMWVFGANKRLITVMPVPGKYQKKLHIYLQKRDIGEEIEYDNI